MENWKKVIIVLLVIVGALLVYIPHYGYDYPLHVDEWNSIDAVRIAQNEGLFNLIDSPVESGFHLFLIIIDLLFPLVLVYKFLPFMNFVLISGVLFYFLNKRYNYYVGLFSIVFFASLKSNVNVLGNWFFVPITFAVVFIYSYLFDLEDSLNDKGKSLLLCFLFLFLIAFIHPSSFLVLAVVGVIFFVTKHHELERKCKRFLPLILLLIPILLIVYYFTGFSDFSYLISRLVWKPLVLQINFVPITFYGLLASFFAFYGFYFSYKRKELLGFRIYFLISLISLIGFWFIGRTLFSAYQRYLYHFMLGAVVFSAIGFYEFLNLVYRKFDSYRKETRVFVLILMVALVVLSLFYGYGKTYEGTEVYHAIDKNDYDALIFLRDYDTNYIPHRFYLDSAKLISPRGPGTASYAISNKASIASLTYYYKQEGSDFAERFFKEDCDGKEKILAEYDNLMSVYSYEEIDCLFLREIYRNEKVIIYWEVD